MLNFPTLRALYIDTVSACIGLGSDSGRIEGDEDGSGRGPVTMAGTGLLALADALSAHVGAAPTAQGAATQHTVPRTSGAPGAATSRSAPTDAASVLAAETNVRPQQAQVDELSDDALDDLSLLERLRQPGVRRKGSGSVGVRQPATNADGVPQQAQADARGLSDDDLGNLSMTLRKHLERDAAAFSEAAQRMGNQSVDGAGVGQPGPEDMGVGQAGNGAAAAAASQQKLGAAQLQRQPAVKQQPTQATHWPKSNKLRAPGQLAPPAGGSAATGKSAAQATGKPGAQATGTSGARPASGLQTTAARTLGNGKQVPKPGTPGVEAPKATAAATAEQGGRPVQANSTVIAAAAAAAARAQAAAAAGRASGGASGLPTQLQQLLTQTHKKGGQVASAAIPAAAPNSGGLSSTLLAKQSAAAAERAVRAKGIAAAREEEARAQALAKEAADRAAMPPPPPRPPPRREVAPNDAGTDAAAAGPAGTAKLRGARAGTVEAGGSAATARAMAASAAADVADDAEAGAPRADQLACAETAEQAGAVVSKTLSLAWTLRAC